jgi:hypothetical protein
VHQPTSSPFDLPNVTTVHKLEVVDSRFRVDVKVKMSSRHLSRGSMDSRQKRFLGNLNRNMERVRNLVKRNAAFIDDENGAAVPSPHNTTSDQLYLV